MKYEDLIKNGKLKEALVALRNDVRKKPADATLRILLFQLYSLFEEWEKSSTQLAVAGDISHEMKLFTSLYTQVVLCEQFRKEVFTGNRTPVIFGEPEKWLASLIQALSIYTHEDGR